jgi:hypothetical protein
MEPLDRYRVSLIRSRLRQAGTGWWRRELESAISPKDCRAMADQCFQWVHRTRTVEERRAYLKLAHVWLEAASAEDNAQPTMPPAPRLQLIRAQELAGGPFRLR